MLKRLLAHTSYYTLGSLLAAFASIVSFPILARIFSVEDYGVLNLISTTLMVAVGVTKLGLQHSIVRFFGEVRVSGDADRISSFRSTVLYGMLGIGLAGTLIGAVASQLAPLAVWNDPRVRGLMLISMVLVAIRVVESGMVNLLRADQRSVAYSVYTVFTRYGRLVLIIGALFLISRSITTFYAATVAGEFAGVALLVAYMARESRFDIHAVSVPLLKSMAAYGIPMIGYEVSGYLLDTGDRYVINGLLGAGPLGIYAAAYNLCEYVQNIFVTSVGTAIVPMFVAVWAESGEEATTDFIDRSLHVYVAVCAAVIAGMAAIGHELIEILASSKYSSGSTIIPWVMAGLALSGATTMVGAGLYIKRRTTTLMLIVALSALFNIGLNFVLVPRMGIQGAAVATLISNFAWVGGVYLVSNPIVRVHIPWVGLLKFGAMAAVMYLAVAQVHLGAPIVTLVAKVASGAALFVLMLIAFDGECRGVVRILYGKLRAALGKTTTGAG